MIGYRISFSSIIKGRRKKRNVCLLAPFLPPTCSCVQGERMEEIFYSLPLSLLRDKKFLTRITPLHHSLPLTLSRAHVWIRGKGWTEILRPCSLARSCTQVRGRGWKKVLQSSPLSLISLSSSCAACMHA